MDELKGTSVKSMGFGLCYKKLMKDRRLPIEAKAIYNYIASYAGAGDTAFPGWKLICYDLGISKTRYYKYLNYLKAYGYMTIEQIKNADYTFSHNVFTLQEYPEQFEDPELIKAVDNPGSSKQGNGENTPILQIPETEIPETENEESNSNTPNIDLSSIWNMAKDKINLPDPAYNEFIEPLEVFSYESNIFTLLCPDNWLKTIIAVRYIDRIHIALSESLKSHGIYDDFQILIQV